MGEGGVIVILHWVSIYVYINREIHTCNINTHGGGGAYIYIYKEGYRRVVLILHGGGGGAGVILLLHWDSI